MPTARADALGLVLAEDVKATEQIPPFDNTAMDGYAVRAADTVEAPVTLRVVDTLHAGRAPEVPVGPGEAVRIMTSNAIRSLPVVLKDRIVGVVSRSDLIQVLAHTDELIRYEITGRFRAEGMGWTVDVSDRVATITGPVTDDQRRHAEQLARAVHGVAAVRVS